MSLPTAPSRTMDQDTFDATTDAFVGALPQFETDMNALAAAMTLNSTTDTSTSSVAIGTGEKTFTVTAGKSFVAGMWLVIADAAAPTTNAMYAQVSSYSGTALVVNATGVQGSGTIDSWQISQTVRADGLTLSGALNTARGSITMHATTMDIWAQPNIIDGTGSAVTITAIANAPQAGVVRILYPITGTIITHGATFSVQGGASYTTGAGDALVIEAITTSTYNVQIIKDTASVVKLNTANGYGSTATTARRWTNVVTNTGPDITYADSADNGGSFTINSSGLYSIKYADQFNAAAWMGISLNLASGGISTAAAAEIIASEFTSTTNGSATVSATEYLSAGDVIRAHTDGIASGTNVNHSQFTIVRVG